MGAELLEFSPLRDQRLPEGISGLLLGGGYPELHVKQLSDNTETAKTDPEGTAGRTSPVWQNVGGLCTSMRKWKIWKDENIL